MTKKLTKAQIIKNGNPRITLLFVMGEHNGVGNTQKTPILPSSDKDDQVLLYQSAGDAGALGTTTGAESSSWTDLTDSTFDDYTGLEKACARELMENKIQSIAVVKWARDPGTATNISVWYLEGSSNYKDYWNTYIIDRVAELTGRGYSPIEVKFIFTDSYYHADLTSNFTDDWNTQFAIMLGKIDTAIGLDTDDSYCLYLHTDSDATWTTEMRTNQNLDFESWPNGTLIDVDDLTLGGDNATLTAASLETAGIRLANTIETG